MKSIGHIVVISNMYPGKSSQQYGVFIKNFVDNLARCEEFSIKKIVISGRSTNLIIKTINYLYFIIKVLIELIIDQADLYYVHYANHSLLPFVLFKKRLKKSVVNFHGSDLFPENLASRIIKQITKKVIRMCKKIVVPSPYFRDMVCFEYNINPTKICISPSGGINTNLFCPVEDTRETSRDKISIGYIGRLDSGKGFELIILLSKKLDQKKHVVHVIGGGALMGKYLQTINQLKLEECFVFHGMQPQIELPRLLREIDVLIFPSIRKGESLGLVGLEAMACGVPVIGSACGGISTYIIDGVNGFLFIPNDIDSLFEKFLDFLELDSLKKENMRKSAIVTAQGYNADLVNNKMIILIKSLLEESSKYHTR